MKTRLTFSDMLKLGMNKCGAPGCTAVHVPNIIYMTQKCHPGAFTETYINFDDKTLVVSCGICKEEIMTVAIEQGVTQ